MRWDSVSLGGPESQYATPQVDHAGPQVQYDAPEARYPAAIAVKLSHALQLLGSEEAAILRAALRSPPPRMLQALQAAGRC